MAVHEFPGGSSGGWKTGRPRGGVRGAGEASAAVTIRIHTRVSSVGQIGRMRSVSGVRARQARSTGVVGAGQSCSSRIVGAGQARSSGMVGTRQARAGLSASEAGATISIRINTGIGLVREIGRMGTMGGCSSVVRASQSRPTITVRVDTGISLVGEVGRMGTPGGRRACTGGMAGMGGVVGSSIVVLVARDGVLDFVEDTRHDELKIGLFMDR